ncbi:Nn.00g048530.m01.CDS01 [Neocucurbitaria sp. VM-36]
MQLLDLPSELFDCIVDFLVGDVGPLYVAKYRLISHLFATEIQKKILTGIPLVAFSYEERRLPKTDQLHIATSIDNARFEQLFALHGGTIIRHEVLRHQKLSLPVIQHLKDLTETVLHIRGSATDELRKQYTFDICTALSSVFWKQLRWRIFLRDSSEVQAPSVENDLSAALAATGNIDLLLDLASSRPGCLTNDCSCLPTPIQAAAACGQVAIVQMISDHIAQETKANGSDALKLSRNVEDALTSATRKSQKQTAHLIFDLLDQVPRSRRGLRSSRFFESCIRHQDIGILRRIPMNLVKDRIGSEHGRFWTPITSRMDLLLREASCSVLRAMLDDKLFDPNDLGDTTPLAVAIRNHRYDLARVLLQYGAQVDGVPTYGHHVTALWHAAKEGFIGGGENRLPGIRFLLAHGANPDIYGDWRSPLRVAEKGWPDVYFLLRQAKEFGVDVALRSETWEQYEKMRGGEPHVDSIELSD